MHLTPIAALLLAAKPSHFLRFVSRFGMLGLFLVSIVDSSFVPLPIPGVTDVMLVLFAARHGNPFWLVVIATAGSALGGLFSHMVGQAGGMAFLEKHVPARFLSRVTRWMENHAIVAVALPAILPPPMPLSAFVLAAGALRMSRKKFLTAFTLSRLARHALAVWLGYQYGRPVLRFWNHFTARWGQPVLIILWSGILLSVGYAFWKLYRTSRAVDLRPLQNPPTFEKPTTVP